MIKNEDLNTIELRKCYMTKNLRNNNKKCKKNNYNSKNN